MLAVDRRRRVDWARLIDNLLRAGMTMQEVADFVGVGFGTVRSYRTDMHIEPAFWVGVKLLKLWADKTGVPWTDAPMINVTPSVSQVLRGSA